MEMLMNQKPMVKLRARSALLRLWLVSSCVSALACSDSDKPVGEQSAALHCSAAQLENDLEGDPFVGPGVDEASGELKLEPGKQYIVSSTYGVPVPGDNGAPVTPQYLELFGGVQEQLAKQSGLLAMKLASSKGCGSGRTLAVWSSEEEMYEFVTSDAHFAAMKAVREVLKPGYDVTHWTASGKDEINWEKAVKVLAE
jgi:heme-degrading monooxygenase HmoA